LAHNITPRTVGKSKEQIMAQTSVLDIKGYDPDSPYAVDEIPTMAAEEESTYTTIPQLEKKIAQTKKKWKKPPATWILWKRPACAMKCSACKKSWKA
jgi:excinuclease ABC subunit B